MIGLILIDPTNESYFYISLCQVAVVVSGNFSSPDPVVFLSDRSVPSITKWRVIPETLPGP